MSITNNNAKLICGLTYGTNSSTIYRELVNTMGFDPSKINCFGSRRPLYAVNADTTRNLDVWFICYTNYDYDNEIVNICESLNAVNCICRDGDYIIEVVDEKYGSAHNAQRITFIKNGQGQYEFLGVFVLIENGKSRIYKRVSKTY